MFNPSVALELNGPRARKKRSAPHLRCSSVAGRTKSRAGPQYPPNHESNRSDQKEGEKNYSYTPPPGKTTGSQASVGGLKKSFLPFSFLSLRNVLWRLLSIMHINTCWGFECTVQAKVTVLVWSRSLTWRCCTLQNSPRHFSESTSLFGKCDD